MLLPSFRDGRRLLLAGFGGLLLLLLVAGADALLVLRQVRTSDAQVRDVYLRRNRALDEVRRGIFQSAIVMRDFLLAPNPEVARTLVDRWSGIRRDTDRALVECAAALDAGETAPLRALEGEVQVYWKLLEFLSAMQESDKRERGTQFFSTDLVRRRNAMLDLVDRIDQISMRGLASSDVQLNATFDRLRLRLAGVKPNAEAMVMISA
jgi:hypothetical protein